MTNKWIEKKELMVSKSHLYIKRIESLSPEKKVKKPINLIQQLRYKINHVILFQNFFI